MNLIQPFESFARALFGVLQMPDLLETADRAGATFEMVRDHFYDQLPTQTQEQLRALAKHLDGLPRRSFTTERVIRDGWVDILSPPSAGEIHYTDVNTGKHMVKLPDGTASEVTR